MPATPEPKHAALALPPLRARFYFLLAALGVLAFAPWIVTEEVRKGSDGFAVAIQDAGSLRFRLLQLLTELPRARADRDARTRMEVLMTEQARLLDSAVAGDRAANVAACPTREVCSRFEGHKSRWQSELAPRFRALLDDPSLGAGPLTTDVLIEVTELDITVRATARAVQERSEKNATIGVWASVGTMLTVALVAVGVWQVFQRIRRLASLAADGDESGIAREFRGADELDRLASDLASGIAAERRQRDAETRRAEELVRERQATRSVADSLSAWIAGHRSLDTALAEVARATGHERAVVAHQGAHALHLEGPSDTSSTDEMMHETLSQIFAIASLADRLLAEKTAQGRLAAALGGLSSNLDAAELGGSLNKLVPHDAAVLELFDAAHRVEHMWAVHHDRLERLPVICNASTPSHVTALDAGSRDGCLALRQRCPGPQLAIPLGVGEGPIGAIHLAREAGGFDRQDLRAAEALAPIAAHALARVQLEARLRFAEQWSTVGAFGRMLAHEIKNPLNSLGLELSLLERRVAKLALPAADQERLASSVEVVKSELLRLTTLTNDYLSIGPKSGLSDVRPVDLGEIVASVTRTHAASMAARGIHLVDELGEDPAVVLGHPDKLKQVVHNLVGNAIEAMASVDVRIATIALRRRAGDWELTVRDTGPGISDPVAIFAPGYTTKTTGTGMGLAISQQIARQHGGRLLARALDSGGAEFTLSIAAHEPRAQN